MPDEGTAVEPGRKPVTPVAMRTLIQVDWILWGILLVVLLYGLVKVSTERTSSPEAGRGLGLFAVLFLLALLAGAAWYLRSAASKQSAGGLITMTVILAWPVVFLIADPAMKAYKARKYAAAEARVGDFRNPTLAAMARAIAANDSATLKRLLAGHPPPAGRDRAGNDLLQYAFNAVREGKANASMIGVMLDAGADPNVVDARSGNTPLGDVYNDPALVRVLVDHGAGMDRIQSDGTPPVVRFIGTREWDSALYLIEKGARLDIVNAHGLSVDYYLDSWKDGVYGDHPEGWAKVREAIAARRAAR